MKMTEAAAEMILQVMKKKGLNPQKIFLEIGVFNGNLGMTFTNERAGRQIRFGDLIVYMAGNINSTGIVVDFGEVDGRKGLIFKGDENGIRSE